MTTPQVVRSSLRLLRRFRVRSAIMIGSMAIGTAALLLTLAVGEGIQHTILTAVARLFGPSDILLAAGGGGVLSGKQAGVPVTTLTMADLEAIQDALPPGSLWDPMVVLPETVVKEHENAATTRVIGHSERGEAVWNRGVVAGETITAEDVRGSARVALLGPRLAASLFGTRDPVGEQLRIGTVPFVVKGVLAPQGIDPHGIDRDEEVHIPISTAMRRVTNIDYLMAAKIRLQDPSAVMPATAVIARVLRDRHALARGVPDDFSMLTPVLVREKIDAMTRVFRWYLPAAAAACLLAACFLSMNIMSLSVAERRGEIGIRKAVGARDADILRQFSAEALLLLAAGLLLGILLGLSGIVAVGGAMHMTLPLPPAAAAAGLGCSMIACLAASLLPARRAARMPPVEALR